MTNTLVTEWDGGAARAVSDVVLIKRGDAGWSVATVARYHDTFRNSDGTWTLARRSMEFTG